MATVLAFDVESVDPFNPLEGTVEIGAAIVSRNSFSSASVGYEVLSVYAGSSWHPDTMGFNEDTMKNFWLADPSNKAHLSSLEDITGQSRDVTATIMIQGFMDFLYKNLREYPDLVVVCDNKVFDPECINSLVRNYLSPDMYKPLPYYPNMEDGMHTGKFSYGKLVETHSMQHGFLLATSFARFRTKYRGLTEIIRNMPAASKVLPVLPVIHDHKASNDATTIAIEYLDMLAMAPFG